MTSTRLSHRSLGTYARLKGDTLSQYSKERTKAEEHFRQAQKPQPVASLAEDQAVHVKTARLKQLRLAKEAAESIRRMKT
jgi:hypothetical protein